MLISRRLVLIILVIFAYVEGILLTIVTSSSNIINTDDAEQIHLTMLENYKGHSEVNISKRSTMNFRNFSVYFQGKAMSSCKNCGLINSKRKNLLVIQGNEVNPPYKYPWMVAIQVLEQTICGGSLINEWFVLTAAHCLAENGHGDAFRKTGERPKYYKAKDVSVAFVTQTYEVKSGPKVHQLIPHPGFEFRYNAHDIALVKLKRRVICNKLKNPICLPTPRFNIKKHQEFTIAGWGYYMRGTEKTSHELREGKVKYLPLSQCNMRESMKKNYYCFKGVKGQSPCKGDSGSPVFHRRGGRFIIVGVMSVHTDKTCDPNQPFFFASVPSHISWIKSVTGR